MESGPRVGTRIERAEEGRCEGEEGVGVAPSVRWTSSRSTPLGALKYDKKNFVGGLSGYIVGYRGRVPERSEW